MVGQQIFEPGRKLVGSRNFGLEALVPQRQGQRRTAPRRDQENARLAANRDADLSEVVARRRIVRHFQPGAQEVTALPVDLGGKLQAVQPGLQLDGRAVDDGAIEQKGEDGGAQLAAVVCDDAQGDDAVLADDGSDHELVHAHVGIVPVRWYGRVETHPARAQLGDLVAGVAARLVPIRDQEEPALRVGREQRHGAFDGAGEIGCGEGARGR